MRRHDILHGGEHGFGAARKAPVPILHHLPDLLPLQIVLRPAQITGNNRKLHAASEFGDVRFGAIGERPDDDMRLVIGDEFGWHGLEPAAKQHVQKERMNHVIAVMPEGDFIGAQKRGDRRRECQVGSCGGIHAKRRARSEAA